jgi:negative regulator of sigma-B (phosphoserine phosphatase)
MSSPSEKPAARIEYGVAARPLRGEAVSGDRYVVRPVPGGVLLAVIDGLGHGVEAAKAAEAAVTILEAHAHEAVIPLMRRCHEALTTTRGVVMSVVSFNEVSCTATWLGVGNVAGALVRADGATAASHETLLTRGGIVGYQLPPLRASVISVGPGDMLGLATDGVAGGFTDELAPGEPAQPVADRILDRYAKDTDDALVLIARCRARDS